MTIRFHPEKGGVRWCADNTHHTCTIYTKDLPPGTDTTSLHLTEEEDIDSKLGEYNKRVNLTVQTKGIVIWPVNHGRNKDRMKIPYEDQHFQRHGIKVKNFDFAQGNNTQSGIIFPVLVNQPDGRK